MWLRRLFTGRVAGLAAVALCLSISNKPADAAILTLDIWDGGGTTFNWQFSGSGTWNSTSVVSAHNDSGHFRLPFNGGWKDWNQGEYNNWDGAFDTSLVGGAYPANGQFQVFVDDTPVPHTGSGLTAADFKWRDSGAEWDVYEDVSGGWQYPQLNADTDYKISITGSGSVDTGNTFAALWTNGTYTVNTSGGLQYNLVVSDSGPSMGMGGAVPEPSSLALLSLSSIGGLALIRRRRKGKNQPNQR